MIITDIRDNGGFVNASKVRDLHKEYSTIG